jgi:hypothetical protein
MLRLLTLSAVLALAACANSGDEGMIVLNNTAVTDTCTLTGQSTQPFLAHGQIYAKSPNGYLLTPLIQSRVVMTDSTDVSQRTILLTGANVELSVESVTIEHPDGSFSNGSVTLAGQQAQFSTLFSGSLPPAGTVNVGFDVIPVQTMRQILTSSGASATDKMTAEVLAKVTILGTLDGDKLSASPFQYPISVCNNCVVVNTGVCPMPLGSKPRTGNACNPFQDGTVDCCTDASNNLVCPADVATM